MKTFFESVVKDVLSQLTLDTTFFIIPNRRSKTFLKKEIIKSIKGTALSPNIISIDDFIELISEKKESPKTTQLFNLYEAYMSVSKKKDFDSYSSFRNWSNMLLNDINDVDMSLASSDEVFKYLYEIQKLQTFSDEEAKSKLEFWKMIPEIVNEFKKILLEKGNQTKGLCHLIARENIDMFSNLYSDHSFIFLGLNSLSKSEELIINHLLENNNSKIYWDCESDYIKNRNHQSGYFFRKYISQWPYYSSQPFKWESDNLNQEKKIDIYETSKKVSQVKTISNILSQINKKDEDKRTAIVLPQNEMLRPLLNSIPKNISDINVSMSIPLIDLELPELTLSFLNLYVNSKSNRFYHKDIINVLSNNLFLLIFKDQTEAISNLKSAVFERNMIYVPKKELKNSFSSNKVAQKLFDLNENTILNSLEEIVELYIKTDNDKLSLEQANKTKQIILIIKNFNEKHKFNLTFESLRDFYFDVLKNQSLSLVGDLNCKVQIMGLLESRGIDFDNVIICSANEGILPKNSYLSTFLPYDLRKKFELPTLDESDARVSYDFYRLLHRANNVSLTYNSSPEGIDSGEKSRFIYQLELLGNKKYNIQKFVSSYPLTPSLADPKEYEKTEKLISRLDEISEKGFSPSALKDFLEDQIRFYDRYVLSVNELDSVVERAEHRGIGIVFHNTMEEMYKPFVGKKLEIKSLKKALNSVEEILNLKFIEEYGTSYRYGKNIIAFKALEKNISKLIQMDIDKLNKGIEIEILVIEELLKIELKTKTGKKFYLKGKMDRIQKENGVVSVLDYKTGNVDESKLSYYSNEDIIDKPKTNALQLICYALMYCTDKNHNGPIKAGIVSFKHINSGILWLKEKISKTESRNLFIKKDLKMFEELIVNIVEKIYDTNNPFKNE